MEVTIFSENSRDFVRIERIEYESRYPSYQLTVTVNQADFEGAINVWVEAEMLQSFFSQLRECELSRRGEAKLTSMSPEELELRIFNTRAKGDFALTYKIRGYGGILSPQLQGGFDFDPALLRQITIGFGELISLDR